MYCVRLAETSEARNTHTHTHLREARLYITDEACVYSTPNTNLVIVLCLSEKMRKVN